MVGVEDASGYQGWADCVVAPASVEELAAMLRRAAGLGVPVTPSGAGTGITGHLLVLAIASFDLRLASAVFVLLSFAAAYWLSLMPQQARCAGILQDDPPYRP